MSARFFPLRHSSWRRLALCVLITLAGPGGSGVAAADPQADRNAALESLLVQDCGSCHGSTLKGGLGRSLRPEALTDRSAEALAEIILDGIPGTPMPPWRGLLTEAEARYLAGILKQGRKP
ncbi:c-type cytochrome [Xanthobacter autotrophicus]|uniref:c-type cytochrome n=1 Tax=Xanthobacter autotrophicus TaxID=280 RepID=UPI00372AF85D